MYPAFASNSKSVVLYLGFAVPHVAFVAAAGAGAPKMFNPIDCCCGCGWPKLKGAGAAGAGAAPKPPPPKRPPAGRGAPKGEPPCDVKL